MNEFNRVHCCSIHPSSMAACTVEENLLDEIFVRLPVKSLMRFKCVSKRWLSHISDPCFCRSHTLRHYTPFPSTILDTWIDTYQSSFLIMPSSENTVPSNPFISDFQFLNLAPGEVLTIKQSCNGLLLIGANFPCSYYVCNPITKQFIHLLLPDPKGPDYDAEKLYLAFQPLNSSHYKVIGIRCKEDTLSSPIQGILGPENHTYYSFDIHVYSSKTGCWTDFGFCLPAKEGIFDKHGIYCNGAIYWCYNDVKSLYFDVENLCFKTFPMPRDGQFKVNELLYFGESGGHLHMILGQSDDALLFDNFELKEDSSEWSVKFHVDLRGLLFENSFWMMSFFCQNKEEDSVLVFYTGHQVILYNLLDYTFKRLIDFNRNLSRFVEAVDYYQVLQYSENLSWDGDSSF